MSIFRTILPTLAGAVLLLAQTAGQQQPQQKPPEQQKPGQARNPAGAAPTTLAANEREFLQKTAINGRKEVEMARVATQKASNSEVKKFAERLVEDHTKANQEIEDLARRKGVNIPAESTAPAERAESSESAKSARSKGSPAQGSRAHMEQLSKLSGEQFDRAFIQRMIESHTKSVAEFERQSKNATDNDIRSLTAKLLPTLKEHLEQARNINKSFSKSKSIGE